MAEGLTCESRATAMREGEGEEVEEEGGRWRIGVEEEEECLEVFAAQK